VRRKCLLWRSYTNLKTVAAYDLCTGEEKWARPVPMTTTPYVEGGKFYGGSYQQWTPQVFIIDANSGDVLVEADFDHRLTGLGFEPSPVRPMGADRLIVGLRNAISCLALE
jgi:outer membrane protein assembly factor BamB